MQPSLNAIMGQTTCSTAGSSSQLQIGSLEQQQTVAEEDALMQLDQHMDRDNQVSSCRLERSSACVLKEQLAVHACALLPRCL